MTRIWRFVTAMAVAGVIAAVFYPQRVPAQTGITSTTLSAAMTRSQATIPLTSDSGVSANSFLYVDGELVQALSEVGTTGTWNVRRGLAEGMTPALAHASGARVWVMASGAAGQSYITYDLAEGAACTTTDFQYAPVINTRLNHIWECEGGYWLLNTAEKQGRTRTGTLREEFEGGHSVMQDDGTAKSLSDTEENFVTGSVLGAIEYREEQAKTASSWITINNELDISADNTTTDEGVEIVWGAVSDATLNQLIEVGSTGGCVAAMITVADISGTDKVLIGWRENEAFQDAANNAGYSDWATIGITSTAGALSAQDEEAGGGTQTDAVGVSWADGERRGLKTCISKAGAPSFYYTAASPDTRYPRWIQVPTTNTGDALTAAEGLVPALWFLTEGTDGPNVTVQWVEITRFP